MSFSQKATRRILSSTAAAAIICGSSNAYAQNSYDAADPTVVSGNVTFDRVGTANTETYTINSNTAVLDFIPNDMAPGGPITFQAAGTEAQYLGGLGITDFTVLNRILAADPSRAIQFDGSVISRLQGSPTIPGGSVWFYSPGGIIIGSSAVFDVGNLLLAAGDPTGGSGIIADPNQFSINSVPDGNAAITVQAGAQISATNPGSYVALVAPAIVQSGTVSTNGSAAYVAAERTTLTFNTGLFDIQTTVGSDANGGNTLIHEGTTRFVDDTGQRRAYLVAVPKNNAITMLIQGGGQLGFDTATGVTIDNGVVVLAAGVNPFDTGFSLFGVPSLGTPSNIAISGGTINADVEGIAQSFAASQVSIESSSGLISFGSDVNLRAGSIMSLVGGVGGPISIAGDFRYDTSISGPRDIAITGNQLLVGASDNSINVVGDVNLITSANNNSNAGTGPAASATGGQIDIIAANGNSITIGGLLSAEAAVTAPSEFAAVGAFDTGDAFGGAITVNADTGSINIGGSLNLNVSARGGSAFSNGVMAGLGTGGTINVSANSGNIDFGNQAFWSANGTGGMTNADAAGGNGLGGVINVSTTGSGSINANELFISALGTGTSGVGTSNNGGSGTGGAIQMTAGGGNISTSGRLHLRSDAVSGAGADNSGVIAQGGTSMLTSDGGLVSIADTLLLSSNAGSALTLLDQDGSDAVGGVAGILAQNGGSVSLLAGVTVLASASAGDSNNGITGFAGTAAGGIAQISVTNSGTVDIANSATLDSTGVGGDSLVAGTSGGTGTGGTVLVQAFNGGQMNIGNGTELIANAVGGGVAGSTGRFGEATAGRVLLQAASGGGQIDITGTVNLSANAFAGSTASTNPGVFGANSAGGQVQLLANDGNAAININGNVNMLATATGAVDNGGNGAGGTGTGGSIDLNGANGTGNMINITGNFSQDVRGIGGASLDGTGGAGIGGVATFGALSGADTSLSGSANILAEGRGGTGLNGGTGTGGRAVIFANSAGATTIGNTVVIQARGIGGPGDGAGHAGGFGQGGTADIFAHGTINIVGNYNANSGGTGGNGVNGADGGDALGGLGSIIADGGAIRFDGAAVTRGSTIGGNIISGTGSGGNAQGGLGEMIARNGGNLQILGVSGFDANVGTSGFGGDGLFGSGSGGSAIGGTSNVFAESGGTIAIAGNLLATASGFGGNDFFDPAIQYADLGGDGTGGTVTILANGGNIIGTSSVSALANGHGGLGVVEGGTATGGTVNVIAIDGLLDFSSGADSMFLSMTGVGGDAVAETDGAGIVLRGGGNGGDGIGGNIFLLGGNAGQSNGLTGIVRAGDIRISENAAAPQGLSAVGGGGAAGAAGQDGGDGGDATGGVMFIGANNENGVFEAGNVTMGSLAIAGAGGPGGLADGGGIFGNGGDGGDAFGRSIGLGAFTDLGASTTGSAQFGDIIMNIAAVGGNGGNALGGSATGGTGGAAREGLQTFSTSIAGPFILSRAMPTTFNNATLMARAFGGDGGTDAVGNRSAGGIAEGFATSLTSSFGFTDQLGRGRIVGNSYIGNATSQGGLGLGDVSANSFMGSSGLIGVNGDVQLASVQLETRGIQQRTDIDGNEFAPYAFVAAIDGIVTVDGDVTILTDNEFNLLPIGSGEINIGGNLNVTAGAGNSQAQSPFGDPVDEINVDGSVSLVLGGDFVFGGDIDVPGDLNVTTGGRIQATNITAGSGITLQAGSTISTGNLLATNDISLTGMADELLGLPANIVTGNISSQTGLINVVTNIGDIRLGNLTSPNAITINAGNGSTNANAGGDIVIGAVQGSSLSIFGTDDLTIGGINATQSINVATTGLASFSGIANAPIIAVTSGDINFGTNGGLGGTNTNDLAINARTANQPIIFGGNGSGGGYNLSAAEATKLRSRTIRFNAQPLSGMGTANITIGDFTLEGSLAGANANLLASRLDFNSPGTIRVVGAGLLNNAGPDDRIALFAGNRIEVVTDLGGSLRMRNAMSNPGGTLLLSATNIAVGTDSLLSQLAANPRFAGRDDIVNAPDGSNMEGGFIESNLLDLAAGDTIVIQNSNTAALRGGFTTGTMGVSVSNFGGTLNTANDGIVDVVVNGRIADGSGGFLVNEAVRAGVNIAPDNIPADFSSNATVNNCLLSGGTCDVFNDTPNVPITPEEPEEPEEPDEPDTIASDLREIIDDYEPDDADEEQEEDERSAELTPASTAKKSPIAPRVPVVRTNRLNSSPTVTDPITGSGNPNFISSEFEASSSPPASTDDEGGQ